MQGTVVVSEWCRPQKHAAVVSRVMSCSPTTPSHFMTTLPLAGVLLLHLANYRGRMHLFALHSHPFKTRLL